eukprot:Phypoly_transcript_06491.p1 GENE.Phypoly_transcript_06491~~Phypoly_transcript_06491.p1  ORF type:complete len:577 (+),score=74.86 Phypoly_transcript_06491:227-1732(+)
MALSNNFNWNGYSSGTTPAVYELSFVVFSSVGHYFYTSVHENNRNYDDLANRQDVFVEANQPKKVTAYLVATGESDNVAQVYMADTYDQGTFCISQQSLREANVAWVNFHSISAVVRNTGASTVSLPPVRNGYAHYDLLGRQIHFPLTLPAHSSVILVMNGTLDASATPAPTPTPTPKPTPPPTPTPTPTHVGYTMFDESVNPIWTMTTGKATASVVTSPTAWHGSNSLSFHTNSGQTGGSLIFTHQYSALTFPTQTTLLFALRASAAGWPGLMFQCSSTSSTANSDKYYLSRWGPVIANTWTIFSINTWEVGIDTTVGVKTLNFTDVYGNGVVYYIDQLQWVTFSNEYIIYDESVASGWTQSTSGATSLRVYSYPPAYWGGSTMSFTTTSPNGSLRYSRSSAMSTSGYTHLRFGVWANQTTSALAVQASSTAWTSSTPYTNLNKYGPYPLDNPWVTYTIPLSDMGISNSILFVWFVDRTGVVPITYFVDKIELLTLTTYP